MSPESQAKKVRKGTSSCVECRHRKVRCIRASEGADTCQNCLARGRTCELQVYMTPTSEEVRLTSRARIGELEEQVSGLWTAVHTLETKLACVPGEMTIDRLEPQSQTRNDLHCMSSDSESSFDSADLSPSNPPTHLLHLFDNRMLGSCGPAAPLSHVPELHKTHGNSELRRLMPIREDMIAISARASQWLSLYNSLFPMTGFTKTGDELLARYDNLQDPNTDTIAIAALLLLVAITVQQAPDDTAGHTAKSIRSASSFIKDVSDTVERVVISDDALAGTLEGIETTLHFLRLQLGRARVRKMWLFSRRAIALAQMIGLPRASMAVGSPRDSRQGISCGNQAEAAPSFADRQRRKAEVWESICAVDRITSMMWSLPLATTNFPLPKRPIIDSQGKVIPQTYLYNLADIASRVLELDSIYASESPHTELFNAVISTDQELRSLASLPSKSWWRNHWSELSIDTILQYCHHYLIARVHLQLALLYDEGQQFAFSFTTCLNACQELARRYVSLRPMLPSRFFAGPVIDLQAFTATVFLLLACYRITHGSCAFPQVADANLSTRLADQAVRAMESAADPAGGGFAQQAADAVKSLKALLQKPPTSASQKITLNLPLIGRIHVSLKSNETRTNPKQSYPASSQQLQGLWQTTPTDGSTVASQSTPFVRPDLDSMDILSYSMEIPENYAFLTDETFGAGQWITLTGLDGNDPEDRI